MLRHQVLRVDNAGVLRLRQHVLLDRRQLLRDQVLHVRADVLPVGKYLLLTGLHLLRDQVLLFRSEVLPWQHVLSLDHHLLRDQVLLYRADLLPGLDLQDHLPRLTADGRAEAQGTQDPGRR